MVEHDEVVLSFIAEWFDPHSQLLKQYLLTYHVSTSEVEMKDLTTRRKFLKKTKLPSTLDGSQFIKGSSFVLLARELKLVDYADMVTRRLLESKEERITILVIPSHFEAVGDIVMNIEKEHYNLANIKSLCFNSNSRIDELSKAMQLLPGMEIQDICSNSEHPFVAISFQGSDCIASVRALVESSPFSHGVVCPRIGEEQEFSDFVLSNDRTTTATLEECTCCIIKPHVLKDHIFGAVINDILMFRQGFTISAMQMFRLDKETAAEFTAVYKGVFPQYVELVDEMCSGPLIALEVKRNPKNMHTEGYDVVDQFRAEAGPWDYSVACELHPQSIRAKFGLSNVENAVHCTDLPKDGVIECQYFFEFLAKERSKSC